MRTTLSPLLQILHFTQDRKEKQYTEELRIQTNTEVKRYILWLARCQAQFKVIHDRNAKAKPLSTLEVFTA